MHLERGGRVRRHFLDREWPAGALFTSAQPVPPGIGMADETISDPEASYG